MRTLFASLVVLALLVPGTRALASGHKAAERHVPVSVTSQGYEPETIPLKRGEQVVLIVTRRTDHTCAKVFTIPARKVQADLPLNRAVEIPFTAGKPGPVRFACSMGMVTGTLVAK